MRTSFCTIITANYYPRALALYRSIQQFEPGATLQVLVADQGIVKPNAPLPEFLRLIDVDVLLNYPLTRELYEAYAPTVMDHFRWSMKPVFISWLLEQGYDKVLYLDTDMFFVNDFRFLWEELNHTGVLLSPNWNNLEPLADEGGFLSSFTGGIYSAGFIGATRTGLKALRWWGEACHYRMGAFIDIGISNDQRYLDILPVYFSEVKTLRHRGCNIGSWNQKESWRSSVDGQTLILGKYPVIFVHFDEMLVKNILRGHDPLLRPFYDAYAACFQQEQFDLQAFFGLVSTHTQPNWARKMKWRLRLRNRLKKLLFAIYHKL